MSGSLRTAFADYASRLEALAAGPSVANPTLLVKAVAQDVREILAATPSDDPWQRPSPWAVPTREQIARAIDPEAFDEAHSEWIKLVRAERRTKAWAAADAVLALQSREERPDDDPAPMPTCNGRNCGGHPHD